MVKILIVKLNLTSFHFEKMSVKAENWEALSKFISVSAIAPDQQELGITKAISSKWVYISTTLNWKLGTYETASLIQSRRKFVVLGKQFLDSFLKMKLFSFPQDDFGRLRSEKSLI